MNNVQGSINEDGDLPSSNMLIKKARSKSRTDGRTDENNPQQDLVTHSCCLSRKNTKKKLGFLLASIKMHHFLTCASSAPYHDEAFNGIRTHGHGVWPKKITVYDLESKAIRDQLWKKSKVVWTTLEKKTDWKLLVYWNKIYSHLQTVWSASNISPRRTQIYTSGQYFSWKETDVHAMQVCLGFGLPFHGQVHHPKVTKGSFFTPPSDPNYHGVLTFPSKISSMKHWIAILPTFNWSIVSTHDVCWKITGAFVGRTLSDSSLRPKNLSCHGPKDHPGHRGPTLMDYNK